MSLSITKRIGFFISFIFCFVFFFLHSILLGCFFYSCEVQALDYDNLVMVDSITCVSAFKWPIDWLMIDFLLLFDHFDRFDYHFVYDWKPSFRHRMCAPWGCSTSKNFLPCANWMLGGNLEGISHFEWQTLDSGLHHWDCYRFRFNYAPRWTALDWPRRLFKHSMIRIS